MKVRRVGRRGFMRAAGLAGAALAFPMVARRSWGAVGPNERLNLALLGAGSRGGQLLWGDFVGEEDVRFVAVCDAREDRREATAGRLNERYGEGVCKAYVDYREVLAREDVDGVVIASPDHWHVPMAYGAAKAGKDMYVEKPMGPSLAWQWRLREAAARSGSVFQYGTFQRSLRSFRRACELVRNGYIGEVERVEAWSPDMSDDYKDFEKQPYGSVEPVMVPDDLNYDVWLGPAPWRPYSVDRCKREGSFHCYDYSIGFVAGWGSHPLDIVQWGLGMDGSGPVRMEGTGQIPPEGWLCDTVEKWDVHGEYGNGVKLRFMAAPVAEDVVRGYHYKWVSHGTTFFGSEGWVSVDRMGYYTSDRNRLRQVELKAGDERLFESPGHARNFLDCMKSREQTIDPLEAAIRTDTISHLAELAVRLGRAVEWDPAGERSPDAEVMRRLDRPMRRPWVM